MTHRRRKLPSALDLTRAQYDGHACVWCAKPLWKNATSAGIARGSQGAHCFDIEVYACPDCSPRRAPVAGTPPRPRQRDDDGTLPVEGWPS